MGIAPYTGPPLSISMTPAFYDPGHFLLRTQLACLTAQTCQDFDVWLIDPHYSKRRSVIPELASRFHLTIHHLPYTPATHISKYYDCAIFNAAFCYSRAPTNARYSCYRFVRPTWVETILSAPPSANIDFYMHAVGPAINEVHLKQEDKHDHERVWHFDSETPNWDLIPLHSGYNTDLTPGDPAYRLGNWPPFMDVSAPIPSIVPTNVYGNIAWRRSQWLALNGTNEVITNAAHWEDLDFDARAANARQTVVRYSHQLYRLMHIYGNYSQRSNVQVDVPLRPICSDCEHHVLRNGGDMEYGRRTRNRLASGALSHHYQHCAWVCRKCQLSGPIYDERGLDHYIFHLQDTHTTRSPILPIELIGRNLSILAEHMDTCPYLDTKVQIYNNSWTDPYYFTE